MIIHGLSTVEFLIQLLQQFRLRNAALSGRKIATVENLVIINPFLADSPMRSSKMLYRVFASVFSQLAREIIGHFASVENAQILKQYIVLPKAAAKDEIFFSFTWHFVFFQISAYKKADNRFGVVRRRMYCFRHSINGNLTNQSLYSFNIIICMIYANISVIISL